jgi:hypothetical protein
MPHCCLVAAALSLLGSGVAEGTEFKCPDPTKQVAEFPQETRHIIGATSPDLSKDAESTIVNLWAAYPHADRIAIYQNLISTSCNLIKESDLPAERKIDRWIQVFTILDRTLDPKDRSDARSLTTGVASIGADSLRESANGNFTQVNIGDVANSELDWLVTPPHGDIKLDGIPFIINSGNRAVIHTRNYDRPDLPIAVRVHIGRESIATVHLLLNGNWIARGGSQVGSLRIAYSDGSIRELALVGMQTIRETWLPNADLFNHQYSPPPDGVTWDAAYSEKQMRGSQSATGFLDRLSISTDPTRRIDDISVINKDWETGAGIIVAAITLETVP